jgi:metal-responsive CopG/Arc/MetJ family transcriptional regulator
MTKMPPKLIDELDAAVSELGTTRSALIRQALEKHLASLNSTATRRSTAA